MDMSDSIRGLLERALAQGSVEQGTAIQSVEAIAQDASSRRYYRVLLSGSTTKSIIAVFYDSTQAPEVGGGVSVGSDVAFYEIGQYLESHGVLVPRTLLDARESGAMLLEDVGSQTLFQALQDPGNARRSMEKAIDVIQQLQALPKCMSLCAWQRRFTEDVYRGEMAEFAEFYLGESPESSVVKPLIDEVACALARKSNVFVHRDFHAWNLHLDPEGRIRVLDFQDALVGNRAYDLASLLNDRDTDLALGPESYKVLVQYGATVLAPGDETFLMDYFLTLIQRDLKVAGRFRKLEHNGRGGYAKWVPQTVRRIGSSYAHLKASGVINANIEALFDREPKLREGFQFPHEVG